jgi:alpha-ketoglutaric semialdehyde dehydrogenase
VFGPAAIIVRCISPAQIAEVLERIEGQLTATLHVGSDDEALAAHLLPILERKAGRLIANGWPTGVEAARHGSRRAIPGDFGRA